MTDPDKLAIVEPRNDDTTLIRGSGFSAAVKQFAWAVFRPDGVIIPSSKTPIIRQMLSKLGYRIVDADDQAPEPPPRPHRMPLPLPECRNCHQPYRRADAERIRQGVDHCVKCGQLLHLHQHDPNDDGPTATGSCPECGHTTQRNWMFCRCGAQLDTPTLDDVAGAPRAPWQQRYADELSRSRAEKIRAWAAGFGTIPSDDQDAT